MGNPFELVTASKLTAQQAIDLWCDDKRLERVGGKENCFINGHRGTGKSMLFRILQYDCQKLLNPATEPDFLSVYFSVRNSELLTEEVLFFQEDSQKYILSESHFSLLLTKQLLLQIQSYPELLEASKRTSLVALLKKQLAIALQFTSSPAVELGDDFPGALVSALDLVERERARLVQYIGLRLFDRAQFDGAVFLFDTLLGPLADFLLTNAAKTLYVLVDDADDLPESHKVILNTWIARRHTAVVFKISTMFGYKIYRTKGRSAIQHPHDFVQYDIATRYLMDDSEDYIQLLREITRKRLVAESVGVSPEDFFPEDQVQAKAIKELEETLIEEYTKKYEGRSVRDHVYRHLSSEYIKRMLSPGRSTDNFTYSGFKTLATLSSGMVRDFIIVAQRMYDNASRKTKNVLSIPPKIQSDAVKLHAETVLEEITNHNQKRLDSTKEDWKRIKLLISGLGNIFKQKMLSEDSERKVFSFAFQDEPSSEIERLLDLAISEGYLMKGFISKKEGTGRRPLYVLTRRLAPLFNLDVTSYSGYLSATSERIATLFELGTRVTVQDAQPQLSLFADMEYFVGTPEAEVPEGKALWSLVAPEELGY